MSKFTDFIDGLKDSAGDFAKQDLKDLIANAKQDQSDFVRQQATNLENWTVMLANGDLTPTGYKKLVQKMEVLTEMDKIRLEVAAEASAQHLATGIETLVMDGLFKLI